MIYFGYYSSNFIAFETFAFLENLTKLVNLLYLCSVIMLVPVSTFVTNYYTFAFYTSHCTKIYPIAVIFRYPLSGSQPAAFPHVLESSTKPDSGVTGITIVLFVRFNKDLFISAMPGGGRSGETNTTSVLLAVL